MLPTYYLMIFIPPLIYHTLSSIVQVQMQRGPIQLYKDRMEVGETLTIERQGLVLGLGYTFTDFFAQGLSFKRAAFFIHLWIQSGRLSAGNIRVPLTRPSSLDDLCLLAPLYNNPKEKEAIVRKFINAFKPDPAYVAEMARLKVLHDATLTRFQQDLAPACAQQV